MEVYTEELSGLMKQHCPRVLQAQVVNLQAQIDAGDQGRWWFVGICSGVELDDKT
jgi:hypothetical protein